MKYFCATCLDLAVLAFDKYIKESKAQKNIQTNKINIILPKNAGWVVT